MLDGEGDATVKWPAALRKAANDFGFGKTGAPCLNQLHTAPNHRRAGVWQVNANRQDWNAPLQVAHQGCSDGRRMPMKRLHA
jgi:hypothetical protein